MEQNKKPGVRSIKEIETFWDKFAPEYNNTALTSQTFYYSLINMLDLTRSKHILEVACGAGNLIPLALGLKPQQCTYLGVDLSAVMIELSKKGLREYIEKIGVSGSLEDWMSKQNLSVKLANAEEKLDYQYKFDRIIANLVVHITEDPVKMMTSFHDMAEEGCLLGVSVWGSEQKNNFFAPIFEALKLKGKIKPDSRTAFHLFNKMRQLGQQTGWEMLCEWQQNAVWPYYSVDEAFKQKVKIQSQGDEFVMNHSFQQSEKIFKEKKPLNFSCQLAVFRRK